MPEINDNIKKSASDFCEAVRKMLPVKKIFLFGSYARGTASPDSDIDIGVVVDCEDTSQKIKISSSLFLTARKIDFRIEPRCIFWKEYNDCLPESIVSEIISSGIEIC